MTSQPTLPGIPVLAAESMDELEMEDTNQMVRNLFAMIDMAQTGQLASIMIFSKRHDGSTATFCSDSVEDSLFQYIGLMEYQKTLLLSKAIQDNMKLDDDD